jgi:hypothetical protein
MVEPWTEGRALRWKQFLSRMRNFNDLMFTSSTGFLRLRPFFAVVVGPGTVDSKFKLRNAPAFCCTISGGVGHCIMPPVGAHMWRSSSTCCIGIIWSMAGAPVAYSQPEYGLLGNVWLGACGESGDSEKFRRVPKEPQRVSRLTSGETWGGWPWRAELSILETEIDSCDRKLLFDGSLSNFKLDSF